MTKVQKADLLIGIILLILIVIFKEIIILVLITICIFKYRNNMTFEDLMQPLRNKALILLYKLGQVKEIGGIITNEIVEEVSNLGKNIKIEIGNHINFLQNQLKKYISNIIRQYIDKVIEEIMRETRGMNEEEIINKLSKVINVTYDDILKEIKNKIGENNKDITLSISKIIKAYMEANKEENLELINEEINKSIDESIQLYNSQIKELVAAQVMVVKNEVDKSMKEQLMKMQEQFKSNNIDIADLELKLKNNTERIMKNYIASNKQQIEGILDNLSKEFMQLKDSFDYSKVTDEVKKTLEYFKEQYIDSLQKNIDETITIVKQLKELSCNTNNVEFIKNRDIRLKFEEALKIAESEILIVSPWMNEYVLNKTNVKNLLKKALEKKVKVKIVYGIGNDSNTRLGNIDDRNVNTIKMAQVLEREFEIYRDDFKLKKSNTHSKVLICDNKFALVTSFNLLSFSGEYNKDSREELAAIITDKDSINKLRLEMFNF